MVIHLLVGALEVGDGIGNSVLSQYNILRELGYECRIYASFCNENYKDIVLPITALKANADDLIIDHIGGYSSFYYCVSKQPCRKILLYHNITPPEYVTGSMKKLCEKGIRQVSQYAGMYDFLAADSQYNLRCLKELGIEREGDILPIPVEFEYASGRKKDHGESRIRFLFVGRCVENKKIEDVIKCFAFYHNSFNAESELLIIGDTAVSPHYTSFIKEVINASSCSDCIILAGRVSDKKLQDSYMESDVFICMSEHEGFCIPVIEAMYNNLVVFAYDSTALGETMGGAGVLLKSKDPYHVAKIINEVLGNEKIVAELLEREAERVKYFSKENVMTLMAGCIGKWKSSDYIRPQNSNFVTPKRSLKALLVSLLPSRFLNCLRIIKRKINNR